MKSLIAAALIFLSTEACFANPHLVSVTPNEARRDTRLTVTIIGSETRFHYYADHYRSSVYLKRDSLVVSAVSRHSVNDSTLQATFQISNRTELGVWKTGYWDGLHGTRLELDSSFTILPHPNRLVPTEYHTLQAAIDSADATDSIFVSPGVYPNGVNFHGKSVFVGSDYYLTSNDSAITTTILSSANSSVVKFITGETREARLCGFTITGSRTSFGGGIYCSGNASPTIDHCIITGNRASGVGGAIALWDSSDALISHCLIKGNTANSGGGLEVRGGSRPTIVHCTIVGNTGSRGAGGIEVRSNAHPVVINSIIWNPLSPYEIELIDVDGLSDISLFGSCLRWGPDSIRIADGVSFLWGEGCFDSDPLFVRGDTVAYLIQEGSPCVDKALLRVVMNGDTLYRVVDGDWMGNGPDVGRWESPYSNAVADRRGAPFAFQLLDNYPNPFNGLTTIRFEARKSGLYQLAIYDLSGRKVAQLIAERLNTGWHEARWNADNGASGVYLVRLSCEGEERLSRVIFLK